MLTVLSDDNRLAFRNEFDLFKDVFYDAEPFTGILKDGNEVTSYLNGNANGDYYCYRDGKVEIHDRYENGNQVESTSYYASGEVKTMYNSLGVKMWSDAGVLVMENDFVITRHYFTNGKIKSIREKNNRDWQCQYFAQNGDLVMTEFSTDSSKANICYEKAFGDHYYELLYGEISGLESDQVYQVDEGHRIQLIRMWFWEVFEQDKTVYFSILSRLLKHPDMKVKEDVANIIAIHKFEPYIEDENPENKACYQMIRENRTRQDERFPDRDYRKV